MGVAYPCQVCETPNGIVWANEKGCYIYTGEKIITLTGNIKTDWHSFIDETKVVAVGYNERDNEIVVKQGCDGVAGNVYVLDLQTGAWTYGDSRFKDSKDYTNFINTASGNLAMYKGDTADIMLNWYNAINKAESSTMNITTKDIDFGNPGQVKRIYAVRITYRSGGASNVDVHYRTTYNDGVSAWTSLSTGLATTVDDTDIEWSTIELSVTPSDIYSIQLRLSADGTVNADFEVNDISIVYRTKRIHA